MISFSTDRSAQIRATKALSPNFKSRTNTQTSPASQDMFIKNSQVNLTKSASIKRLQPAKPLRTTSFGSGPLMKPHETALVQKLMSAQEKFLSRVMGASEHSSLEEVLGQNPNIDKKEWAKDHLDMAKAFLSFGKDDAYARLHAYIFALKAVELDEANQQVHHFIKNDLGVPLEKAFSEKTDAILNDKPLTDEEAQLSVLSPDEVKIYKKFHDAACRVKDNLVSSEEDARMAEILGEEQPQNQKAMAKSFFDIAVLSYELGPKNASARTQAYGLARMSASMDPNNPAVHYFLGSKLGVHPQEALIHVSEAVKQKPFEVDYLKLKLDLQALLGQHEDGLKTADRAISLSPKDASLRFIRAEIHLAKGNFDGASADYKQVAEFEPQNIPARANLGLLDLRQGKTYDSIKWYDEAEKAFNSIEPEKRTAIDVQAFSESVHNRGVLYMNLGVFDKAQESLSKAIEAAPQLLPARFNRAMVSFYQGNYTDSMHDMDAVIENVNAKEQPQEYVAARAMKALNLFHLDREDEAQDLLDKTGQTHPELDVREIMTETYKMITGLGK